MVEGTPEKPYGGLLAHFNVVESNMRLRLGVGNFSDPETKTTPETGASKSIFFLMKSFFKVILDLDKKTPSPFIEDFSALGDDGEAARTAKPDHIYMDCMGFGMGCSCLQELKNDRFQIHKSRYDSIDSYLSPIYKLRDLDRKKCKTFFQSFGMNDGLQTDAFNAFKEWADQHL
ncbi:GCLC [Mytilus edulis]|uniref:Glutamate--cysteine ligase n=1 Tax=Mytilus edulis TaxID=6550 RepID=A0A8S3RSN2_MYTED|nr:GCLC [Mytilus edulis]